jgi:PAS domain S-box-containing protein
VVTLRIQLVLYALFMAAATAGGAIWYGLHKQDTQVHQELDRASRSAAALLADDLADALKAGGHDAVRERVLWWVGQGVFTEVTVLDPLGNRIAHAVLPGPSPEARRGIWRWIWGSAPSEPVLVVARPLVAADGERAGEVRVQLPTQRDALSIHAATMRGVIAAAAGLAAVTLITAVAAGGLTNPLGRIASGVSELGKENFNVRLPLSGPLELAALAASINHVAGRLRSMAALQASATEKSAFINNVVESMVATLIVVDREARIRALNQATVELLGYQSEELIGKSSSLICVADGFHLTSTRLEQLLGRGSMKDHEVAFISKDNRHIPVSLSGSAIKDAHGRITGYVCIGTDITQRKQAEAEKQKLNTQLVATSRQAGMAEVATGVLHNVGNVLNSINVSASVVDETLRKSRISMVKQVADLLGEHASDLGEFLTRDEKGKLVPSYLIKLAQHLSDEQTTLINETRTLASHIGHIKDIISLQQSISRPAGVIEPVALRDLVEDAVQMVNPNISKYDIEVVREYTEVPQVRTDRHKVLQILVNLMTNAMDAMKETVSQRPGRLVLRIGRHRPDPRCLRIEVEDNGMGITPEHLGRIFTHGFTTKKKGHGFGLHASALASKELQGSLTATSQGPGHGATFTLVVPVEPLVAGADEARPAEAGVVAA